MAKLRKGKCLECDGTGFEIDTFEIRKTNFSFRDRPTSIGELLRYSDFSPNGYRIDKSKKCESCFGTGEIDVLF